MQSCSPSGTWEWIHSPNGEDGIEILYDVTGTSSTDVWTTPGDLLIRHWDGVVWDETQPPSDLADVQGNAIDAIAPDSLWAVGAYQVEAYDYAPVTFHWDGTQWAQFVPSADREAVRLTDVSGASEDDVWAVGFSDIDPDVFEFRPLMMHWDGATWETYPAPVIRERSTTADRVVAVDRDDAWAVGEADLGGTQGNVAAIWHWDGIAWSMVKTPVEDLSGSLLAVGASGPRDVWAVGRFSVGRQSMNLAIHWDGRAWRTFELPGALETTIPSDISVAPSGRAWVVGKTGHFPNKTYVAQWDGVAWSVQRSTNPGPVGNELLAVQAVGDSVWAVGDYQREWGEWKSLVERRCL
jgi:hypothetical protein